MAITQVGQKAVLNPGTDDETWGICLQSEISHESNKHEIQNGEGDTEILMYTDAGRMKYSGTFVPLSDVTAEPGDTLSVGGMTITIDSVTKTRKRGDVPEFKIEGTYYPLITGSSGGGGGGGGGGGNSTGGSGD